MDVDRRIDAVKIGQPDDEPDQDMLQNKRQHMSNFKEENCVFGDQDGNIVQFVSSEGWLSSNLVCLDKATPLGPASSVISASTSASSVSGASISPTQFLL